MNDDGVVGVVLSVERYQMLVADASSCEAARGVADDFDARVQRLTQECDDLRVQLREVTAAADRLVDERDAARRELAERDEAEREAEAKLPEAVRKIRDGSRVAGGFDPELVDENVLDAADQIVRIVATAPATAIAAVLAASEDDAEVETLRGNLEHTINAYENEHAQHMRAVERVGELERKLATCEAELGAANGRTVEALALAGKHSARAEEAEAELAELRATRRTESETYLRCEACGHEEGEPFAPGDSHAGCDGPLICVTCGTGIATPRVEPDEAMVRHLAVVAFDAHQAGGVGPWEAAVRAVLADPLVASRMTGEPRRSEASGPLVDAIGRILRDTIDHEPDFRRGAERIAAEVARRLPTARELADGYLPFVWSQSDCYARAANILSAIRTRLGLDPQAPPGRAEPDDAMVERLAEVAFRAWRPGLGWDCVGAAVRDSWCAVVRAVLAHPLVASRMTDEPQRSEASGPSGPLVDAIGRILRDTIDHEPDLRRAAERVVAHVERSLPARDDLVGPICEAFDADQCVGLAALAEVRSRLGLDAAAPEREEPSEPEPDGTWATLPAEVRNAVAEFASPSPRPCAGRIGDPDKVAAVLHRHMRPAPDAVSVEDIATIIELHVTGGVPRATTAAAARTIHARYGSPPTVPALALPSVEEVDEAVRTELRRPGSLQVGRIRNAVLDLVRERQPEELQWWAKLSAATRTEATQAIRRAPGPVAALAIAADLLAACVPSDGEAG